MTEIESKHHSMAKQAGIADPNASIEAGSDGSKKGKKKNKKDK